MQRFDTMDGCLGYLRNLRTNTEIEDREVQAIVDYLESLPLGPDQNTARKIARAKVQGLVEMLSTICNRLHIEITDKNLEGYETEIQLAIPEYFADRHNESATVRFICSRILNQLKKDTVVAHHTVYAETDIAGPQYKCLLPWAPGVELQYDDSATPVRFSVHPPYTGGMRHMGIGDTVEEAERKAWEYVNKLPGSTPQDPNCYIVVRSLENGTPDLKDRPGHCHVFDHEGLWEAHQESRTRIENGAGEDYEVYEALNVEPFVIIRKAPSEELARGM